MDTGNILAQRELPLTGRETTESLSVLAAETGARLLGELLETLGKAASSGEAAALEDALTGRAQQGEASYCSLIQRDSGLIDWTQSALELDAKIRAYYPWPLARTGHGGRILYILEAQPLPAEFEPPQDRGALEPGRVLGIDKKFGILAETGRGILALTKLQYQSKKALSWQVFINGARDFAGSCLSGGS
jgi:methionyl-tRNA formyltransferase